MKTLLGFLLVVMFVAVSLLASDSRYATVYVYRPSHFAAMPKRPSIYVDGKEIGRLHNGRYLRFEVAPGQHLITSATYVEGSPYLTFESGRQYFFEMKVRSGPQAGLPPGGAVMKLLEVQQQQALKQIEKLKSADVKQGLPL